MRPGTRISSSFTATASTMSKPPSASPAEKRSPSNAAATSAAQSGSDVKINDASTDGRCLNASVHSQIVNEVEITPVHATLAARGASRCCSVAKTSERAPSNPSRAAKAPTPAPKMAKHCSAVMASASSGWSRVARSSSTYDAPKAKGWPNANAKPTGSKSPPLAPKSSKQATPEIAKTNPTIVLGGVCPLANNATATHCREHTKAAFAAGKPCAKAAAWAP
mmetsp:Transcript_24021/g.62669  ORF Transcript_24021/g.62669 Transcript_24021/m.62669 type:complete len:222 (+) Transcript_24021:292-957(+)